MVAGTYQCDDHGTYWIRTWSDPSGDQLGNLAWVGMRLLPKTLRASWANIGRGLWRPDEQNWNCAWADIPFQGSSANHGTFTLAENGAGGFVSRERSGFGGTRWDATTGPERPDLIIPSVIHAPFGLTGIWTGDAGEIYYIRETPRASPGEPTHLYWFGARPDARVANVYYGYSNLERTFFRGAYYDVPWGGTASHAEMRLQIVDENNLQKGSPSAAGYATTHWRRLF